MSNSSFSRDFWTRVLAENNLESPGYHEAVKKTNERTAEKRAAKLDGTAPKKTTRKKK